MAAPMRRAEQEGQQRPDKPLPPLLDEFRTALREEVEAARRAASSAAVELTSGRRIGERAGSFQYLFSIESPLNIPDDSPADLLIAGQRGSIEATIVSVDGLSVIVSVPLDLGEFIGRARLQSDLTHLLRLLITRIEAMADAANPAGDRLLGIARPSGESESFEHDDLYKEQREAVASGLGRDITFIWGPPGTGKTITIGALATELHRRERSVLLVSHTNAAVDQALWRVAEAMNKEELEKGLVLRLGVAKDQRVAERPELLVETHVQRRSAELVVERDELTAEQLAATAQLKALERLITIGEWLLDWPGQIAEWRTEVDEHERLKGTRGVAAERLTDLKTELAPWLALVPEAERTLARAQRLHELQRALPLMRERAAKLTTELTDAQERWMTAEALAQEARAHVPHVRAARERLASLRAELPEREPLLAAADQELAELRQSIAAAENVLARARQANAITRRLRGLPHPDQQEQTLQSLRIRLSRLGAAREQTAAALERLRSDFREARATIDQYGHLPDPDRQASEAQALRAQEARLRLATTAAAEKAGEAERELHDLGDPAQQFRGLHEFEAEKVLSEVARIRGLIAPIEHEVEVLDVQIGALTLRLREGPEERAIRLRALRLVENVADEFLAVLAQIEEAMDRGREMIGGRDLASLRQEREQVDDRLREIATRLAEIGELLEQIERLVISEARVVATTLTRAYKRDSVQARQFDTVILDEASMAPLPALWVVAARAQHNVVIVGDFRQLPPIKHSTHELAEKWLGTDVFQVAGVDKLFLRGTEPRHCVALRVQQRMHPAISEIANQFFYDRMLRDGDKVNADEGLSDWYAGGGPLDEPVLLVDTSKLNAWVTSVNHGGRASRLNFLSATVCADIALLLLKLDRDPFVPGRSPRILLASPYRPQAKLMALLARELSPEVVAGTAHTFQGDEAPVVIFDLVNDDPHWRVGMFSMALEDDTKRLLNVALTRAKRRLIIVGDLKWIEQKASKDGILRRLIAHLKTAHKVVDAGDVVPAGLAARAAAVQLVPDSSRAQPIAPQLVINQDRFYDCLYGDLSSARERTVIYSPFMTADRVGRLEAHLRAIVDRGGQVWVVTKTLEERDRDRDRYEGFEAALRAWGIRVVHKRHMHEKLVIIDGRILWQGSLNPLSYSDTQEIMERRDSREIVDEYARTLRLDDLLGPYSKNETTCPYCSREVVAAEGADEPFYWRCVGDDCFRRSIGDPMPVDGRVVCRHSNCGGALEFRWPNERPFWRCTLNPRHRQPLARAHLRLPKMRELVPARELHELDRKFG